MKEIKASKPVKHNTKKEPSKFDFDFKKFGMILGSFVLIGAIGYGGYSALKPKPVPNWIDLSKDTSVGYIKHIQSQSYFSKEFNGTSFNETEDDIIHISLKKIDNKNSVWLEHDKLNFHCVSTFTDKCSFEFIFDKNPSEIFQYDGGSNRTAYLLNPDDFINKLRVAKEVTIKVNMRKVFKDLHEKSNSQINGKFVDHISKEYRIKVSNIIWN
jgi:hypothetical protein